MKDFLKALVMAPFVIPHKFAVMVWRFYGRLSMRFACWILDHDWYKGVCVRCGNPMWGPE